MCNITNSKVQCVPLPVLLAYKGRRGISPLIRNLDTRPEGLIVPAGCFTPSGRFGEEASFSLLSETVTNRLQSTVRSSAVWYSIVIQSTQEFHTPFGTFPFISYTVILSPRSKLYFHFLWIRNAVMPEEFRCPRVELRLIITDCEQIEHLTPTVQEGCN